MKNQKQVVICFIKIVLITSLMVAAILSVDPENEKNFELYYFPIQVEDNYYIVTVLSNYSSPPEVSYGEMGKSIFVDFRGNPENSFFNVTVPTDLIGNEISLIDKYYIVSEERYMKSFNGTHTSIYFTFDHPAYVKHFEIKGT